MIIRTFFVMFLELNSPGGEREIS